VRVVHFRGDILAGPARGRNHRPTGAVWLARLAARQHVREHYLLVIGIGRFELRHHLHNVPRQQIRDVQPHYGQESIGLDRAIPDRKIGPQLGLRWSLVEASHRQLFDQDAGRVVVEGVGPPHGREAQSIERGGQGFVTDATVHDLGITVDQQALLLTRRPSTC
jgi:hypothetical protein